MKKYKVEITDDANQDIKEIIIYIKQSLKEPQIAMQHKKAFKDAIIKLEDYANIYNVIDEEITGLKDIRKINVKNFMIFYRINESKETVQVISVFYAKSNWRFKIKSR